MQMDIRQKTGIFLSEIEMDLPLLLVWGLGLGSLIVLAFLWWTGLPLQSPTQMSAGDFDSLNIGWSMSTFKYLGEEDEDSRKQLLSAGWSYKEATHEWIPPYGAAVDKQTESNKQKLLDGQTFNRFSVDKFIEQSKKREEEHWKQVIEECHHCLPEEHGKKFEQWVMENEGRLDSFGHGLGERLKLLVEYRKLNEITT